jgi:hypothetical protein
LDRAVDETIAATRALVAESRYVPVTSLHDPPRSDIIVCTQRPAGGSHLTWNKS